MLYLILMFLLNCLFKDSKLLIIILKAAFNSNTSLEPRTTLPFIVYHSLSLAMGEEEDFKEQRFHNI